MIKKQCCNNFTIEDLSVGQYEAFSTFISREKIEQFAEITGDFNPLHLDPEYAAQTNFKKCIAHGKLIDAYFSTLIGMYLPGKHALYLSQSSNYLRPVYPDTTITIAGEVIKKSVSAQMIVLKTTITDSDGNLCVEGIANVQILSK